jgi:hypothetical protein
MKARLGPPFPLAMAWSLALLTACFACSARAGIPDPAHSDIGKGMALVGTLAGVADPAGKKAIVIRDALGHPVVNSTVEIHLGSCTSPGDIRLCSYQPFPGVGISCTYHEVAALTDGSGTVLFGLIGAASNPGGGTPGAPAPGNDSPCATVRADGVLMGTIAVATYDQNGTGGVDDADLALFLNDRFSLIGTGLDRSRSDYDFSGTVDVRDLALFLRVRFAGGSATSCPSACP